jgi:protein-tyrosine phosphatase
MNNTRRFLSLALIGLSFVLQSGAMQPIESQKIGAINFSWLNSDEANGKLIGGMRKLDLNKETQKAYLNQLVNDFNLGLIISLTDEPLDLVKVGAKVLKEKSLGEKDSVKDYILPNGKSLTVLHLPIPDFHTPMVTQVEKMLDYAKLFHSNNKNVVVHCTAGKGRTGTMLSCWLAEHKRISGEAAIAATRAARPGSVETSEQEKFVKEFAASQQQRASHWYSWILDGKNKE